MSADELRARFSQIAETVVPMEDPHGRLMTRRRKRFRARLASFATLTAAVIAGGVAGPTALFNTASGPSTWPEPVVVKITTPSREEYIDRLVKAPIRGNLGSNVDMVTEVQRAFSEFQPYQGAKDPSLVFLNQTDQMLQAVVIYRGGDQPIAIATGMRPRGSVKDLITDPVAYFTPVSPFLVMPVSDPSGKVWSVVGLAPPGCAIETSAKGRFTAEGAWARTYEPEPTVDYAVRNGRTVNELWRVRCDGRVREVRTADDYLDSAGAEGNASVMYDRAVRFGGAIAGKGIVKWQGNLPGFKSRAMLVSPSSAVGPAMLAVGPFPKVVLATDLPENGPVPTATGRDEEWSMIALGVAGDGLSVVRMPRPFGDRTVLGDQVFVFSEFGAARIEAVDLTEHVVTSAPLKNGTAILTFSPGAAFAVRAVTAGGVPTRSVRFTEQAKGSRVFGDQLFKDW